MRLLAQPVTAPFQAGFRARALWLRTSAALALLWVTAGSALAFQLSHAAFSGGTLDVAGGSFTLGATVGEAGVVGTTSGGSFVVGAGFWSSIYEMIATDTFEDSSSTTQWVNALRANGPNPFRDATTIAFTIADESPVKLVVYDAAGRRVATLVNESWSPGFHQVHWDGRDESGHSVASGIYFYRLSVGSWSDTRKFLKLR